MLRGGIRKLGGVLLLALSAAAAWAVAPALSTTPYVPQAVDFEQRLDGLVTALEPERQVRGATLHPERAAGRASGIADHAGEGPVVYRTEQIEAPNRFDLVGVAGVTKPLEFRTRSDGESWTRWVETTDGNPVWAGGADAVQVRSRGPRIEGKLHYVNVTGTESTSSRLLNGLRSAVSSAFVTAFGAGEAQAAGSLRYVSRESWGANSKKGGCKPRDRASYGKVKRSAIHHTVNTNGYPAELGPSVVLGICRYHRNANGWDDIGYNALVDRFGVLYEGRGGGLNRAVIGAHAGDWNSRVTGVALIGNHVSASPSRPALRKLSVYLAWKLGFHGFEKATGGARIVSDGGPLNRYPAGKRPFINYVTTHRHLNDTSCAGDATEALLKKIRRRIQRKLDQWDGKLPKLISTEGETPPKVPKPGEEPKPGEDDGGVGLPTS